MVIKQCQYDWIMEHIVANEDNVYDKDFMDSMFEVAQPMEEIDRLGSLNEFTRSRGFRVAPNPEVSGLRGLGQYGYQVYIDEANYSKATHFRWRDGDATSEWLEHRVLCTRDVLACLSRETCSGSNDD